MSDQKSFEAFNAHLRADAELMGAAHEASEAVEREEMAFLDAEKNLTTLRDRVSMSESRIMAEVAREKDGEKIAFTNDTQRKAEQSLRMGNDPSHRDAVRALAEGQFTIRACGRSGLRNYYAIIPWHDLASLP